MADAQDILLFVASSTGQNGYTYELGQPIELDDDVERVTMSIKDLNVPFSWWNTVGRGFRLYTTASPSTGWYTYTMNGAYDPGYIREYLAELCNTNGWRSLIDGEYDDWFTLSIDAPTARIDVRCLDSTGSSGHNVADFTSTALGSTGTDIGLGFIFGFETSSGGICTGSSDTVYEEITTTTTPTMTNNQASLFLHCDLVRPGQSFVGGKTADVLDVVRINVSPGYNIYVPDSRTRLNMEISAPRLLKTFKFRMTLSDGTEINFRGEPWELVLQLKIFRKQKNGVFALLQRIVKFLGA